MNLPRNNDDHAGILFNFSENITGKNVEAIPEK